MLLSSIYWTVVLNAIISRYLNETTICLVWNDKVDLDLQLSGVIVNINLTNNFNASLLDNVINFEARKKEMFSNELSFDDFTEKLIISIEKSHCETFIVFYPVILEFVESFLTASKLSIWRSQRNTFVFAFDTEQIPNTGNYFQHYFYEEQPRILLVERASTEDSYKFQLKTNKFVGSRFNSNTNPKEFYLLDYYNAKENEFEERIDLFPDKTQNLEGRELILAPVAYSPTALWYFNKPVNNAKFFKYNTGRSGQPELQDLFIEGTEISVVLEFCEKYNCTIVLDISDVSDWGNIYPNYTGDYTLGLVIKRKAELSLGAMYAWKNVYVYLDVSAYFSRSGITCIVPIPKRQASWVLPLQPFQLILWLAVLSYVLIETICLCLLHYLETKFRMNCKRSWIYSFQYAYITALKLIVSQGGNQYISSVALRVLLFACFMNDIIITSIYAGGLSSILTIPNYEEAADSLERLERHQLKWGANSFAWVATINETDDKHMNTLMSNFKIYTDDELLVLTKTAYMGFTIERLQYGHYAVADYIQEESIDRFKIMQDDLYYQYTVAFAERIWALLPRFNNLLYILHSSGISKIWEWRVVTNEMNTYIQKRVEASNYEHGYGPVKLGMSNFIGILLLWLLGILISTIVFIGEILISSRVNKTKKIKTQSPKGK